MRVEDIKAVIGTNSWGGKTYGKLVRGSYVDTDTIRSAVDIFRFMVR